VELAPGTGDGEYLPRLGDALELAAASGFAPDLIIYNAGAPPVVAPARRIPHSPPGPPGLGWAAVVQHQLPATARLVRLLPDPELPPASRRWDVCGPSEQGRRLAEAAACLPACLPSRLQAPTRTSATRWGG
jgi:hypothetical protein